MTGTGSVADPFIIYDVNDLQAVNDDLTAYYELANDIDAAATLGWNAGKGFQPLGAAGETYFLVAASDVEATGTWTVFPASPTTKWDKVADGGDAFTQPVADNDATYIQCTTTGRFVVMNAELAIPPFATITRIRAESVVSKATSYDPDNTVYVGLKAGGAWYRHATSHFHPAGVNYSTMGIGTSWTTNPATGEAWTVEDIMGTSALPFQGFGLEITRLDVAWYRITALWYSVSYAAASFIGHFDGKGYTISDLYINRPGQNYVGLFGRIDLGVKLSNVTLEDCDITGRVGVGSLVGSVGDLINDQEVVIDDCHASGAVTGEYSVGGLLGVDEGAGGGGGPS